MKTVNKFNKGLDVLFSAGSKIQLRSAFDNMMAFRCKVPALRKKLKLLETVGKLSYGDPTIEAIIYLSNKVEPCLKLLQPVEQEELNAALCHAVSLMSRLIRQGPVEPAAAAAVVPETPIDTVLTNKENSSLRQHIESLERQLGHVKAEREKVTAAHRAVMTQHTKDNASLRAAMAKLKKELDESRKLCFEKEASLQSSLVQLAAANEEVRRLKVEARHTVDPDELEKKSAEAMILAGAYGTSKYGFEEVMSLRSTNDALRLELHRERSQRSSDRLSQHTSMEMSRIKTTATEKTILDLREHLDAERRRHATTSEDRDRVLLQLQQRDLDLTSSETKKTEAVLQSNRLREKVDTLQRDLDEMENKSERQIRELREQNSELASCLRAMRVALAENQEEIAHLASKGGEELQKISNDRSRITLRLESLLEENEHLWSNSLQQDKRLRSSGEIISNLSQKIFVGGSISQEPAASRQAEEILVSGRQNQLNSTLLRETEEKWAHRLQTETEQLTIQLKQMEATLQSEMKTRQDLEEEVVQDSVEMSTQLRNLELRLGGLMRENSILREENSRIRSESSASTSAVSVERQLTSPPSGLGVRQPTRTASLQSPGRNPSGTTPDLNQASDSLDSSHSSWSDNGTTASFELDRVEADWTEVAVESLLGLSDEEGRKGSEHLMRITAAIEVVRNKSLQRRQDSVVFKTGAFNILLHSLERALGLITSEADSLNTELGLLQSQLQAKQTDVEVDSQPHSVDSPRSDVRSRTSSVEQLSSIREKLNEELSKIRQESFQAQQSLKAEIEEHRNIQMEKAAEISSANADIALLRQQLCDERDARLTSEQMIEKRNIELEEVKRLCEERLSVWERSAHQDIEQIRMDKAVVEREKLDLQNKVKALEGQLEGLRLELTESNRFVERSGDKTTSNIALDSSSQPYSVNLSQRSLQSHGRDENRSDGLGQQASSYSARSMSSSSEDSQGSRHYDQPDQSQPSHQRFIRETSRKPSYQEHPPASTDTATQHNVFRHQSPRKTSDTKFDFSSQDDASSVGDLRHQGGVVSDRDLVDWENRLQVASEYAASLAQQLQRSESKCQALEQQIQSVPSSLLVAQAEKRVLEAKLQKAISSAEIRIQTHSEESLRLQSELQAFLKIQNNERELLQEKIQQQSQTIHQLTLHLQVLQISIQQAQPESTVIPPAPWEPAGVPSVSSKPQPHIHQPFKASTFHMDGPAAPVRATSPNHNRSQFERSHSSRSIGLGGSERRVQSAPTTSDPTHPSLQLARESYSHAIHPQSPPRISRGTVYTAARDSARTPITASLDRIQFLEATVPRYPHQEVVQQQFAPSDVRPLVFKTDLDKAKPLSRGYPDHSNHPIDQNISTSVSRDQTMLHTSLDLQENEKQFIRLQQLLNESGLRI